MYLTQGRGVPKMKTVIPCVDVAVAAWAHEELVKPVLTVGMIRGEITTRSPQLPFNRVSKNAMQ
jgi:hypothetical protein